MTAEEIIQAARKEIGVCENPAGSNKVKYNTWYYGKAVSGDAYPWCMAFVQWLFHTNGAGALLPVRTASCGAMKTAAQKAGLWVTGNYRPGDIAIYDFTGKQTRTEHTGIIVEVMPHSVAAIEGNTGANNEANGGQVQFRQRDLKFITGAVRPEYEEDDMNVKKLSDADIIYIAIRMQTLLGAQSVSETLRPELEAAVERGITNGKSPNSFVTRAQAAVMALRASEK